VPLYRQKMSANRKRAHATEHLRLEAAERALDAFRQAIKPGGTLSAPPIQARLAHYWSDDYSLWDRKKEIGTYFGIGPFSANTILSAGAPQDGPFLFFKVATMSGNKGKQMLATVRKQLATHRASLQIPDVSFGPLWDEEECLVNQPMFDLLTLPGLLGSGKRLRRSGRPLGSVGCW
jgi:hypothetical protein